MTDPTTVGSEAARVTLQRRREARVDHVHEIPFGEKTLVECPDCGETMDVGIYGNEQGRSYSRCWSWDCEAYHKFRRDRDAESEPAEESADADTEAVQAGLEAFAAPGGGA